jgi:hypothetical protein
VAIAGAILGLTVALHDEFGNLATGYAGTIGLAATDPRALLPGPVTYAPVADRGSHAFSTSLRTTGSHVVTAADTANAALSCTAPISITAAAPKLVVVVPPDANAGYPVTIGVAVKDLYDNAITDFTGTVTFTSTDAGAGAAAPAPIAFNGTEGGVGTTTATFVTLGTQTVTGTAGTATGAGACAVHGLVYTAPASGRVRLVANAAQSNTQVVQLDLVANERLERSSFFGGGPAAFTVGMNLPLDTTRAIGDAALFAPGNALPLGTGTAAAAGRIGASNGILYTVVSRKRVTGTIFTQSTEVPAGGVFYSVRLKLTQTGAVGAVFDGAQLPAAYRAAIRDQFGDDFVNQGEFGVGRLEIR